jgi:hypothetical protein
MEVRFIFLLVIVEICETPATPANLRTRRKVPPPHARLGPSLGFPPINRFVWTGENVGSFAGLSPTPNQGYFEDKLLRRAAKARHDSTTFLSSAVIRQVFWPGALRHGCQKGWHGRQHEQATDSP